LRGRANETLGLTGAVFVRGVELEVAPTTGDNIAVVLVGSDRAAMQAVFEKLAEGGQVKMPLTDGAWGGAAAWLSDRFGINWNLDLQPE